MQLVVQLAVLGREVLAEARDHHAAVVADELAEIIQLAAPGFLIERAVEFVEQCVELSVAPVGFVPRRAESGTPD